MGPKWAPYGSHTGKWAPKGLHVGLQVGLLLACRENTYAHITVAAETVKVTYNSLEVDGVTCA